MFEASAESYDGESYNNCTTRPTTRRASTLGVGQVNQICHRTREARFCCHACNLSDLSIISTAASSAALLPALLPRCNLPAAV